jgi:ERO1-like protein alpha
MPYDEARLWKGDHENVLRKQLQAHFQNITKVMDCVGCEKCKLWGKLQLLGASQPHQPLFIPGYP